MLLTVVTYHVNSPKMSAIEESATTYRRLKRPVRTEGLPWRAWKHEPVANLSVLASGRPGCMSGSRHAAVNCALGACAVRREIEGHAVVIPGS
jgi:hypothetical protein